MDDIFDLPSGARLRVTPSPFADAKRLQNELWKAAKGSGVGEIDLAKLREAYQKGQGDVGKVLAIFFDALLSLTSSDAVDAAVFKCAERAAYLADGTDQTARKVDRALFDDPEMGTKAREDYFPIQYKIAEVNVGPFIRAAFSALGTRERNGVASQSTT